MYAGGIIAFFAGYAERWKATKDVQARIRQQLRAIDREARRPAVPIVICGRDPGGWRVLLMRGGRTVSDMDAGAARRLAEQINKAADLIEGKCW